MTHPIRLWPLPLAAGLLPALASVLALALAMHGGLVPVCNPFIEGCVSISRAARHDLPNHVFRSLVLPAAVLQALAWLVQARALALAAPQAMQRSARALAVLGVAAGIALVLYGSFLGTEGQVYRWLRRYGTVVYFGGTCLAMLLTGLLVAMSGIDLRTRLLPDQLTLPLMWLGFVASIENLYVGQKAALLGAMAGYLSLWSVYWLFEQLTGKEGMGHGDFKLLAALGAWTGLAGILPTVLISSLVGAVIGSVWLAMKGKDTATPIPFGPYLAIAGWITFFWGRDLVGMYMRFAGLA